MQNGQVSRSSRSSRSSLTLSNRRESAYEEWWRTRSALERRLILAALASLVLVLLVFFVYMMISNAPEVCTSPICVRTSMEILNYIDKEADPCRDFYRFSCGNFLRNTSPDNLTSRSAKDIMLDEIQNQIRNMVEERGTDRDLLNPARKFYRACMNETAIEKDGLRGMKQIFRQIGGWPLLDGGNWHERGFDWKQAVHKLRRLGINFEFFLVVDLQRDKADPGRYILTIDRPPFTSSAVLRKLKDPYLDFMVDLARYFGAGKKHTRHHQREVFEFMFELAKISEQSTTGASAKTYNPLSLSELQYGYPNVSWREYINGILAPAAEITYDDVISVANPVYLKKLLALVGNTSKRILANFIVWQTVHDLLPLFPSKMLDKIRPSSEAGSITMTPRWHKCLEMTKSRFGVITSAAYVQQYFDQDSRRQGVAMMAAIKDQFRHNVANLDWLDEKTKELALEELASSVEEVVSYDSLIADEVHLYTEVSIVDDQFLMSTLNLNYVGTNIRYGRLRQQVRADYFDGPEFVTGLNVTFSPRENVLRLPAGAFQNLLYQKDRPQYMNYGALGTIMAHEIYHVIIEAEYRDLRGELSSWWSSRSLLNYGRKLQCLADRYGRFVVSEIEEPLIFSTANRDEDMADLAGMKVAYDAYTKWILENGMEPRLPGLNYSPYQLFWISSAIHHCAKHSILRDSPDPVANYKQNAEPIRVNGALQNLDEFAVDFGCPAGSPMNPINKCHVW